MANSSNFFGDIVKVFVSFGVGIGTFAVFAFLKKTGLLYRIRHKVDITSKRYGGELVAEVLKAHNIKFLFTLTGGHTSPVLVAAEKMGIRVIDTRHEVNAVFAADAVARLSGSVGVAVVTAGPGLTNAVTAVKNAQMAESPVLLLGGAAPILLQGRGALQDIDQMSLFKPLCKYCTTVKYVRDIIPTLRKALQIAQSDTPGPVFVEIPADVLHPYQIVLDGLGMKSKPKGLVGAVINWYLRNYLYNLFAGAWESRSSRPLPVSQPLASHSDIKKCVDLIAKAKRPLILLGSQSVLPPTPVEELRKSLEHLGIPCFLGGMARGLLGRNSPIHIRQKRQEALKHADLVVLAGAVCDFRLDYGRVLSRHSKIISVNRNKEQLYKNSDLFWKPTIALQADAGSFVKEISQCLDGYKCSDEWISELKARDSEKEMQNIKMSTEATDVHLNPLKVLLTLEDVMSDDSIIVADGGDFVGSAAYILRPRGPLRWLDTGAFGTLGVGGGFALGAKVCRPESEVWIIYGDGSLGYSIAEFDTFTRHKVPIIAVVGNDACWTQVAREQIPMFNSSVACDLAFLNYETVAEGYGGKGLLLDRSNEDKMTDVFRQAQKLCKEGHSVLINCMIGTTKFREGSTSA